MFPKYLIEYRIGRGKRIYRFATDDPVACEEFLVELLDRSARIEKVQHEGRDLRGTGFDWLIRTAGGMLAARRVCRSLGIKPEEERFRFGFAA
jgi:hypothetical protein